MSRIAVTIALLAVLILATMPPAQASSDISGGASCGIEPDGTAACAWAVFETSWQECGYYESQYTCKFWGTYTLHTPSGHCATASTDSTYAWTRCALSEDEDVHTTFYSFQYALPYTIHSLTLSLCLDSTDLQSDQCTHWFHNTSPAPGPVPPENLDESLPYLVQNLDYQYWHTRLSLEEGTGPVGVRVFLAEE